MSQHYFSTTYAGSQVTIILGWDRPIGHHFMVIERDPDDGGNQGDDDEEEYVYSNLNEQDAFTKTLNDYRGILRTLGIAVPESMFLECERDRAADVGNRYVRHGIDGAMEECGEGGRS